ncbi:hypothetical protein [Megamonas funiformis]|uniref:hypothetical protein n=1 Tax=Megamonas funiformis TaxID=437897 RepID=UPI0022E94912|nr:hypothetical protein [Megamonas funiformis]
MTNELKKELKEMEGKIFEFYGFECLDNYLTSRGFDSMFDVDGWKDLLIDGFWATYDYTDDGEPNNLVTVYIEFATELDAKNAKELLNSNYEYGLNGLSPETAEPINLKVIKVEF